MKTSLRTGLLDPSPAQSPLSSHAVVRSARHDVSSPADAAVRAVGVHAASVHARELKPDAVLTLIYICKHTTHTHTHNQ